MGVGAPTTTVVIDNGGHTCKVGFAGQAEPVKSMPNGIAKSKTEHKVFVADQLDTCKDFSALQYRLSLERGVLVNWDTQAEVWARAFGPEVLKIAPAETSLLLSEAPLTPSATEAARWRPAAAAASSSAAASSRSRESSSSRGPKPRSTAALPSASPTPSPMSVARYSQRSLRVSTRISRSRNRSTCSRSR